MYSGSSSSQIQNDGGEHNYANRVLLKVEKCYVILNSTGHVSYIYGSESGNATNYLRK